MAIKDNLKAFKIHELCQKIYANLGWGYLEDIYKDSMEIEFQRNRVPYKREVYIRPSYDGVVLPHFYKADFVCFGDIIVEVKAVKALGSADKAQLLNYIKATNAEGGYLVNFCNTSTLQFEFLPNLFEKKSATMTLKKCEKEFDGEKIVHCASPEKLIKVY